MTTREIYIDGAIGTVEGGEPGPPPLIAGLLLRLRALVPCKQKERSREKTHAQHVKKVDNQFVIPVSLFVPRMTTCKQTRVLFWCRKHKIDNFLNNKSINFQMI